MLTGVIFYFLDISFTIKDFFEIRFLLVSYLNASTLEPCNICMHMEKTVPKLGASVFQPGFSPLIDLPVNYGSFFKWSTVNQRRESFKIKPYQFNDERKRCVLLCIVTTRGF